MGTENLRFSGVIVMLAIKEKKQTIKDYKLLPEGAPYQLIEGELIMTPAPNPKHQLISGNLFKSIAMYVDEKRLGVLFYSPIDIYLSEDNAFQPDIVFISSERRHIIKDDGIHEAPELVIEILSPSTAYYDIKKKFMVYEKSGVREYWIVDPEMNTVEIYFNENGHFSLKAKLENKGEIESFILKGLRLTLEEIFSIL
jgi:Uma2 family endonuclease